MTTTTTVGLSPWTPGTPFKPGETIIITKKDRRGRTISTLFTVYRPPRRRGESPIDYYKRTKCVDDNYARRHKGRYYCNPAHCSHTWANKALRDEHLKVAYAALG